jgi:phosphatidate cytidylyltransferase
MRSRLLVAAIGIPLVFLALGAQWQQQLLWALVVSLACSTAVLEFYWMMRPYRPFVPAGLLPVLLAPLFAWRALEPGIFAAMLVTVPLVLVFASLSSARSDQATAVLTTLAGVAYVAPAAGLIVVLRAQSHGFALVLLMLAGVWANDTGAYFTGRFLGRRKLAPRISPNKTVEGFVGGFVLGTFVVWYGHFMVTVGGHHGHGGHYWMAGTRALLIGMAVALATPVGDLFESMLKRSVGVKDSGHLLGEHGGALDRLDSILLAAPVMYAACFYTGVL